MQFDEKAFISDLDLYVRTYQQALCQQASDDLTEIAREQINNFYNEYSPTFYKRTDNFKSSFQRYYKNHGNYRINGGVRLTTENMSPYFGNTPAEDVAPYLWAGNHGNQYKVFQGEHIANAIRAKKDSLFSKWNTLAHEYAKKQSYQLLKFN